MFVKNFSSVQYIYGKGGGGHRLLDESRDRTGVSLPDEFGGFLHLVFLFFFLWGLGGEGIFGYFLSSLLYLLSPSLPNKPGPEVALINQSDQLKAS